MNLKKINTLLNHLGDTYDALCECEHDLDEFTYKHADINIKGIIEQLLIIKNDKK